jgi:hypothetical protein
VIHPIVESEIPFLGRIILEIEITDEKAVKKAYGLSSNSSLALPDEVLYSQVKARTRAAKEGKILKLAEDCFGEAFQKRYGKLKITPEVGDYVKFVPYENYKFSDEDKFVIIADIDIISFRRGEK